MGRFNDILTTAGSSDDDSLPEVWKAQFPLLLEAFFPPPGKASGTFLTPKFSVTVFSEGNRVKAVLGSRGHKRKFWLTLSTPEAILEQVEVALKEGKGEWREVGEAD